MSLEGGPSNWMTRKELQNSTHHNPLKNPSLKGETQSSNPQQMCNPWPTPMLRPTQQTGQFSMPRSHSATLQPLELSHVGHE